MLDLPWILGLQCFIIHTSNVHALTAGSGGQCNHSLSGRSVLSLAYQASQSRYWGHRDPSQQSQGEHSLLVGHFKTSTHAIQWTWTWCLVIALDSWLGIRHWTYTPAEQPCKRASWISWASFKKVTLSGLGGEAGGTWGACIDVVCVCKFSLGRRFWRKLSWV